MPASIPFLYFLSQVHERMHLCEGKLVWGKKNVGAGSAKIIAATKRKGKSGKTSLSLFYRLNCKSHYFWPFLFDTFSNNTSLKLLTSIHVLSILVMIHNRNRVLNPDSLGIQIVEVDDSWCLVFIHTDVHIIRTNGNSMVANRLYTRIYCGKYDSKSVYKDLDKIKSLFGIAVIIMVMIWKKLFYKKYI